MKGEVSVFNPFAQSHCKSTRAQCYKENEQKKGPYDVRVEEVEHEPFSSQVISTLGKMQPIAKVVYRCLVFMIAEKRDKLFSQTLFWLRCWLSFPLLCSAIACLCGAHSSQGLPSLCDAVELTCLEGRVPKIYIHYSLILCVIQLRYVDDCTCWVCCWLTKVTLGSSKRFIVCASMYIANLSGLSADAAPPHLSCFHDRHTWGLQCTQSCTQYLNSTDNSIKSTDRWCSNIIVIIIQAYIIISDKLIIINECAY